MKKTITKVVRCALVSLFSFLFISSAQADDLKMALFNYCNTGYEVTGWHSCQQEGGGSLNSETDNGVSVGGANIGGNFKRSFSKLVSTDLPAFATSDMQANLGIEVPYNVYISGVANGAKTDGTITISGLDADSSYVIYAGCGHDNGNIGKSSCGFKVPSNGCTEVGSLDYVVTVASSWGRSGTSTVVADSFTSFSFNESICAGADGLALIRVKGIVPKDNGTIDLFLTGERAGINFLAIKELPPEVFPETTITAETVKVSDINAASDFSGCTAADTVIVNLVDTKTIEFDTAFSFGKAKIKLDGDLLLDSATEPTDIAKFDFKGVTGQITRKWLIKDLPVGTGMAINFKQDSGKLGDSDEAGIPGLTIYGNVWNNTDGGSGSLAAAKMFDPNGSTVIADTMSVSWTGSTYQWTDATTGFLKGYLDDSGITFSTIVPFDRYDVYIICATDTGNAQFGYKKINGVNYSANANGEAVANSTAAWGASHQLTPILGKNVMHLEGLTAQNFTITESPKVSGTVRGCIAAIVIVKTAPPAAAVTATISADTDWSRIVWSGTPADNTPLELTITDSATVKLDTDVVAKNIKLIGNNTAAQVIGIEGTADKINAFLGKVTATTDFAGKFNYRYDATNGLTADSALLDTIKSAGDDKIFTFLGSGSNGATMDFNWNGTFNTHLVFDGGKHTFKRTNGGATQTFGANGTAENSTILVKDGTTLDLYGHDFCGWNAAVDVNGIIRVNSGATLNLRDYSSGTFFFSARLYLDVGSNTYVYNAANALRFNGGNVAGKEQIYVPASEDGVATITIEPNSYMYIGQENNPNAGFFIGEGSTLKIVGDLKAVNAQRELGKRGAGTLEITGNVEPIVKVDAGSLGLGGAVNSIVFDDDATVTSAKAVALKDFTVADGKTLTLDATAGDIAITKAPTNNGTIKIIGGNVAFMPNTNVGTIVEDGGKAIYGYIVDINNLGKFTIPEGKTAETIRLFDAAGNAIEFTDNKDGTVSFDWQITGGVCWWDYEFEGNGNNDGTEGTALSWDGNRPRKDAEFTADGELYVSASPWRNVNNWPTTATFVMYGTMVGTDKTYQIGFGSTYVGTKYTVFLATDTVSENTVNLCICFEKNAPTILCQMTVPNAQTAKHLYAFTLKTVESKTVVDIYLDGELLQSYPFDSQIAFGGGFQIGSGMGGVCEGYNKTVADDPAVLDFLRVYETELNAAVHQEYAKLYPYVSPNGSYQRNVTDTALWTATEAWTKEGTEPVEFADAPVANATVKLSVSGETTLGINLDADTSFEAIQINGDNLTVALAEGEQTGKVKSAGRVTANANITFKYDAFDMAGAPLTVKQGKTVTFDLSMVDMTKFFSTQSYDLTGYLTLEEGANITFIVPAELHGRTAEASIDPTTQHYIVTVTAPDYDFVYENGVWKWGTQEVTEEIMNANPTIERVIKSDLADMTLGAYNYTVEDGATLTLANETSSGTITINAGGIFDVNGVIDTGLKVVLNGGKLVNNSETGVPVSKKQYASISQTAASTIGGLNELAYVCSGYAANTLDLGDATLSKVDENTFTLCNTTVQNGAFEIAGGKIVANRAVTFDDTASLTIGAEGALEVSTGNSDTLTIGAITSYEGATLTNAGTISDFTLTGAITLAGEGTFGTITLDDAALDVATVRNLMLAGEGSVKATITAEEIADGAVYIFTKAEGATIEPENVTLVDESGEVLTGYSADFDEYGNYIAYFFVAVAIPEIAGTDVVVTVEGVEDPIEVIGGFAAIPYGAHLYVTYTVKEGKLFKSGASAIELEYESVTVDPEIANDITEDDVTVDAGAKIGDVYYLDIPAALSNAEGDQTVVVLQDAELVSLTVPEGVTLDLNNKTVQVNPANITNNGTIIVYDEKTVLALIDTHGMIKFGQLVTLSMGYMFPEGTIVTVRKVQGVPGATRSVITVPEKGILINLVGAAAKKDIAVQFENPTNSALLLAGAIERGSHDYDTQLNVGGYTIVGAPLIIGMDGEGMDYATYPNNKAILQTTYLQFDDDMVSELIKKPVSGCIQLIPEVGVLSTATDLSSVIGTRLLTVDGATIKHVSEGPIHTYTAEWIKPGATVEPMAEKPEELAAAATFTATEAGAPKYADYTATLTITADKDVAQDAIILAGQFNATDLEDPAGINNNYDGEWIDMPLTDDLVANDPYTVITMPWNFVAENVQVFNCGLKNLALAEETTFTVTLTIAKDDDTVLTKEIAFTIPAAEILPTAEVTPITAEGYAAAVEFTAGEIGKGYENWTAEFVLTSDVAIGADEIKLGGSYAAWQEGAWVNIDFPGCEAGGSVSVLGLVGHDDITVQTVFETIQSFKCGVKNIGLKNDATFTLKFVITDGKTTKDICSIDNLTVKAKTIEPVDPEDPQEYDTPEKAQEAAAKMNGEGGTIKPEYINAPAGFEGDKAEYASLFKAVVDGKIVTVKLTEAAQESIKAELKNADNEATILMPDAEGKATIAAKPGLFYGIKAVNSLSNMATAEGQNWVMATGATVKVEVPDVTDADGAKAKAAFFQVTCSAKKPVE